jgi:NADH-quinone oxidoreductase subunit K
MTPKACLLLAAALASVGIYGVLTRRSILVVLMALELVLNAANLVFLTFARLRGDAAGHTAVLFVLVVGAVEVTVGLAVLLAFYAQKRRADLSALDLLRG